MVLRGRPVNMYVYIHNNNIFIAHSIHSNSFMCTHHCMILLYFFVKSSWCSLHPYIFSTLIEENIKILSLFKRRCDFFCIWTFSDACLSFSLSSILLFYVSLKNSSYIHKKYCYNWKALFNILNFLLVIVTLFSLMALEKLLWCWQRVFIYVGQHWS